MEQDRYDALVIGAGPNGLAAAIAMQQAGIQVLLIEAKDTVGGGLRSEELLMPGYVHDICSAIHPMALQSPFFSSLPLADYGLTYVQPPVLAAHPLEGREAVGLYASLQHTASQLGADESAYIRLFEPLVAKWPQIVGDVLAPFHIPRKPFDMLRFGLKALRSADSFVKHFQTAELKALWGGMAAHAMLPLTKASTAAIALVLATAGHTKGWPIALGGSQAIAQALLSYFKSLGGKVMTDFPVVTLQNLPEAKALLFDVGPKQLLQIVGGKFSKNYQKQLQKYRYGMGVFKMDWILEGPIPFQSTVCRQAGTVHLGNTYHEIARAEWEVWNGKHPEKPFVLLAQQSLFDPSRTMMEQQVVWAYCHVPHGSNWDMTQAIEQQIERFAPGFRERIIAKHSTNAPAYEQYNPNYVGGDINGGAMDIRQLFTRPSKQLFSPYRTSAKGIYICSSSTPPGGGVHGMCGYYAAKAALSDIFKLQI